MINLIIQNALFPLGDIRGPGPLGLENVTPRALEKGAAADVFVDTISKIIGFLTAVAIIWFIFQFILGAMSWITAGGDAKAVEAAKAKLSNAVLGIVVVLTALVIVGVIGALLKIDILNLGMFIRTLTPGGK